MKTEVVAWMNKTICKSLYIWFLPCKEATYSQRQPNSTYKCRVMIIEWFKILKHLALCTSHYGQYKPYNYLDINIIYFIKINSILIKNKTSSYIQIFTTHSNYDTT